MVGDLLHYGTGEPGKPLSERAWIMLKVIEHNRALCYSPGNQSYQPRIRPIAVIDVRVNTESTKKKSRYGNQPKQGTSVPWDQHKFHVGNRPDGVEWRRTNQNYVNTCSSQTYRFFVINSLVIHWDDSV